MEIIGFRGALFAVSLNRMIHKYTNFYKNIKIALFEGRNILIIWILGREVCFSD